MVPRTEGDSRIAVIIGPEPLSQKGKPLVRADVANPFASGSAPIEVSLLNVIHSRTPYITTEIKEFNEGLKRCHF